jgi:opacity protein-like surface antigen
VFRPYLAAGFGGLKASLDGITRADGPQPRIALTGSNEGVVFAYQLRAGAGIRLARRVEALVGYRYLRSGELLFIGTALGNLRPTGARTHHVETGLKIAL